MVNTGRRALVATFGLVASLPGLAARAASTLHEAPSKHGARPELGASAAFDARGRLWAVKKRGQHVMLWRSDDQGSTWRALRAVNRTPEAIAADGDARPKIAIGARGELYVSWTQPLAKPYTGFIRFARSLDAGRTFREPMTVHTDRQPITHRFDAITVTREGRVFVAWIDKRDGEAARATQAPYRGAALYYAVSGDRGATFRGDYKVADHSCECCRIALLPRANGTVTAFWRHVFEPNLRDHAIATLRADGSVEGFRRATFDDWAIDACPHHGPSLAEYAGGHLHAVWFTLGTDEPGAIYGRLRENGVNEMRRIGGETAEHPDIAALGKRLAIVWKEFDGERLQLLSMRSDDAGRTWRHKTLAVTNDAADQPRLVTHGGRFYALWNTRAKPLWVVPLR